MSERKVYCPETDTDCTRPECSTSICVLHQERIFAEQRIAEWEANVRLVNREAAAWRAIKELVAEHNALIDANKDVALDINSSAVLDLVAPGSSRVGRLYLPERGRRSRKLRETLLRRVLLSKRPGTVARLEKAMRAILAEERARLIND